MCSFPCFFPAPLPVTAPLILVVFEGYRGNHQNQGSMLRQLTHDTVYREITSIIYSVYQRQTLFGDRSFLSEVRTSWLSAPMRMPEHVFTSDFSFGWQFNHQNLSEKFHCCVKGGSYICFAAARACEFYNGLCNFWTNVSAFPLLGQRPGGGSSESSCSRI